MQRPLLLLAGFLLTICAPLSGAETPVKPDWKPGEWPQWRGPLRDGCSSEKGLNTNWEAKPPKLLWMAAGMGKGFASVSVVDETIYTTGNFGDGQSVVATRAAQGEPLWRTPVTDRPPKHDYEGSRSTPTVDGDRLYVVTSDGTIACLARGDGKLLWKHEFAADWQGKLMSGWGFAESPLVDGDRVVCTPGGNDAILVALDKMTGREIWRSKLEKTGDESARNGKPTNEGAGYSSIVISNAGGVKQYVQLVGRGLIGVRATDGKLLWRYKDIANNVANIPTAVVSGDFVFTSTGYGTGAALLRLAKNGDGVSAKEVYFKPGNELQNHHGGFVLVGKHLFLGNAHNNGFPTCVEMSTGEIVWGGQDRGPGTGSAAVTFYDGHLIFRYQSGEVALIQATPEEYRLKGTFKPEHVEGPSWSHPVVSGGRLFLREQDKLMCYDLKK